MSNSRILLIDRPGRATHGLARALEQAGHEVREVQPEPGAVALVSQGGFSLVLAGRDHATEILEAAAALRDPAPVILLDAFATPTAAVEDVRRGAFATIPLPCPDEQILITVQRALEQESLRQENRRLRHAIGERFEFGTLVSRDPRMRRVFDTVEAVADSRATLLIQGESGTGKTVLARAIHGRSGRAERPFVVVNCGAIPASLLESELFGHVRGAFTGAVRDRSGKFESAEGGTIFLDEIATASPELQIKLLRVIEEGRFERVGESRTRTVDVRILAATNQNLADLVEQGAFRADLYYRIHVVAIDVPPLRERLADVPLLANRFLERLADEHGRVLQGFDAQAVKRLLAHPWPGNVRELENTVERGVLLARGARVTPADLWQEAASAERPTAAGPAFPWGPWGEMPPGPLREALEQPERWLIVRALEHYGGNRQETSRALGINRATLFNKMRKYHIQWSARSGSAQQAPAEPDSGSSRRVG